MRTSPLLTGTDIAAEIAAIQLHNTTIGRSSVVRTLGVAARLDSTNNTVRDEGGVAVLTPYAFTRPSFIFLMSLIHISFCPV